MDGGIAPLEVVILQRSPTSSPARSPTPLFSLVRGIATIEGLLLKGRDEAYLPAEQSEAGEASRFSPPHGHPRWARRAKGPTPPRTGPSLSLSWWPAARQLCVAGRRSVNCSEAAVGREVARSRYTSCRLTRPATRCRWPMPSVAT